MNTTANYLNDANFLFFSSDNIIHAPYIYFRVCLVYEDALILSFELSVCPPVLMPCLYVLFIRLCFCLNGFFPSKLGSKAEATDL